MEKHLYGMNILQILATFDDRDNDEDNDEDNDDDDSDGNVVEYGFYIYNTYWTGLDGAVK